MRIKSRLPDLPPIPDANVFNLLFTAPQGAQITDYTVYIDSAAGLRHSFRNYYEFVRDAATALGAPPARGGLGLSGEAGDIVGIFSHNCVVRGLSSLRFSECVARCANRNCRVIPRLCTRSSP